MLFEVELTLFLITGILVNAIMMTTGSRRLQGDAYSKPSFIFNFPFCIFFFFKDMMFLYRNKDGILAF